MRELTHTERQHDLLDQLDLQTSFRRGLDITTATVAVMLGSAALNSLFVSYYLDFYVNVSEVR